MKTPGESISWTPTFHPHKETYKLSASRSPSAGTAGWGLTQRGSLPHWCGASLIGAAAVVAWRAMMSAVWQDVSCRVLEYLLSLSSCYPLFFSI